MKENLKITTLILILKTYIFKTLYNRSKSRIFETLYNRLKTVFLSINILMVTALLFFTKLTYSNQCRAPSKYAQNYPNENFRIIRVDISFIPKDKRRVTSLISYIAISKTAGGDSWFKIFSNSSTTI
jgi:uncharacterized membrane protein